MSLLRFSIVTIVAVLLVAGVVILAVMLRRLKQLAPAMPVPVPEAPVPEATAVVTPAATVPDFHPAVGSAVAEEVTAVVDTVAPPAAVSSLVQVLEADVASAANFDHEYTIVPVDSEPQSPGYYEIDNLALTDRSQGQYVPSYRDSVTWTAPAMKGKLVPIRKELQEDVQYQNEITHTSGLFEISVPPHNQTIPDMSNFLSTR
jgi:hypothetical protein